MLIEKDSSINQLLHTFSRGGAANQREKVHGCQIEFHFQIPPSGQDLVLLQIIGNKCNNY